MQGEAVSLEGHCFTPTARAGKGAERFEGNFLATPPPSYGKFTARVGGEFPSKGVERKFPCKEISLYPPPCKGISVQ